MGQVALLDDWGAEFDETGLYRYRLWRRFRTGERRLLFVMLNPSTADALRNDPTVARCCGHARRNGFASVEVVNLFAYRATKPRRLLEVRDPVGPGNDAAIVRAALDASEVVVAYGLLPRYWVERAEEVISILHAFGHEDLLQLGETQAGFPRHPLYVRSDAALEVSGL